MNDKSDILINARFLTRPVTGVERVAIELLKAFEEKYLDDDGNMFINGRRAQIKLVIPTQSSVENNPFKRLALTKMGKFNGHAWEQLALPFCARGKFLINLCNTGPVLKKNNLVFLHDAGVFHVPDSYSFAFRSWYQFLMHCFSRVGTSLMTNSRFSQRSLAKVLGIQENQLPVVTLGHEHVNAVDPDQSVLERLQLKPGQFVLAVGSANPLKNHAGLLKATQSLDQDSLPCVVVGRFNHKVFSTTTEPTAATVGTRHVGPVSDQELVALYQNAALLVIPSLYEGFGLPPLEAMASGCPVLLSDRASLPEIGGNAAQYCNPQDPADIGAAIQRICSDPALRKNMSKLGTQRSQLYTWHRGADDFFSILNEVLAK